MGEARAPATVWSERRDAAQAARRNGDPEGAVRLAAALCDDAERAGELRVASTAAAEVARVLDDMADSAASVIWLERALDLALRGQDPELELESAALLAGRLCVLGQVKAGALHLVRCSALLEQHELPAGTRLRVYFGLMVCYQVLGLSEWSRRMVQQHLEAERLLAGLPEGHIRMTQVNLINALRYEVDELAPVDPEGAAARLAEAASLVEAVEPYLPQFADWQRLYALTMFGIVRSRQGQVEAAEASFRAALALPEGLKSDFRITLHAELAALLLNDGRLNEASRLAQEARTALWGGRSDVSELALWELHLLGRLSRAFGDWAQAHACMEMAAARLRVNVQAMVDASASNLARSLSEQSLRLQNADLRDANQSLTVQASTDALTGLFNRRALQDEFARQQARGVPLFLLLVDIDHFKQVNDLHSHLVGDEVLRQVAGFLSGALRDADRVGRYGGEEFALLLGLEDEALVASVAERLRARVAGNDWSTVSSGLSITISGGWTRVQPGEGFEAAVNRADAALYAAKRGGRNQMRG